MIGWKIWIWSRKIIAAILIAYACYASNNKDNAANVSWAMGIAILLQIQIIRDERDLKDED